MKAPFVPEYHAPSAKETPRKTLSLFELNSMVNAMLRHTMPGVFWLAAEISELRVASNGHCYLEFVQKDETSGSLVAKARGNIWRGNYIALSSHFERQTGQKLTAGIKVLVAVTVTFHELYGYSLNVTDIDPAYTLGDLARRRREIIRQLEEDGVTELNKELPLPRLIHNVAVISSATAAGYGDFCKQLRQSGFSFQKKLFPATMQGKKVEETVIAALDKIAGETGKWDVVVIIRGGGATADLGGFDSYLLAANVAQFPLPVLTGIGHERDDTILDFVAHKKLKTPTAVAAFLIDSRVRESVLLDKLISRLSQAAGQQLQGWQCGLDALARRLGFSVKHSIATRRHVFDTIAQHYNLAATRYTSRQRERLLRTEAGINLLSRTFLQNQRNRLENLPLRLRHIVQAFFAHERLRLSEMARNMRLADPGRILALGFSITMKNGEPVTDATCLSRGDTLTTRFAKGETVSKVLSVPTLSETPVEKV